MGTMGDALATYTTQSEMSSFFIDKLSRISPLSYDCVGDGTTDDTEKFNDTIAIAPTHSIIDLCGKSYLIAGLDISNKTHLRITNGKLILFGTGAYGFKLVGTCDRIEIDHVEIQGDGVLASSHSGISNASGQTLTNIKITDNYIHDIVLGISVNANLSGQIQNIQIKDNTVENIFGVDASQGYGIHISQGDLTNPVNGEISGNHIINAYRHSIYVARGIGYVVRNNRIKDHRKNASDQSSVRAAINVSRSQDVVVDGNILMNTYTCGIMIDSEAGFPGKNILISNNKINIHQATTNIALAVGYLSPSTKDAIEGVQVIGNTMDSVLILYYGKKLTVCANHIFYPTSYAMQFTAIEEAVGGNAYSDDWHIIGNYLYGTSAFRFNDFAKTSVKARIEWNQLTISGPTFNTAYVITNTNIIVNGHGIDGATGLVVKSDVINKLGVGNSATGSTLGSVVKKIEVFDASGTSLGFLPVYNAIT
jgi:hypothetical protein